MIWLLFVNQSLGTVPSSVRTSWVCFVSFLWVGIVKLWSCACLGVPQPTVAISPLWGSSLGVTLVHPQGWAQLSLDWANQEPADPSATEGSSHLLPNQSQCTNWLGKQECLKFLVGLFVVVTILVVTMHLLRYNCKYLSETQHTLHIK